ncbi:MAG: hypothetical protein WAT81_02795 [Candidatus Moraniibacteriota bacterium]
MGISQTKNNLRWSVFVFSFLCLFSSALYVAADEASTTDVVVFDDADSDGLSNEEEKIYGTDSEVADTDGDGYSDGVEIEGGFNPLKPAPGDRVTPAETDVVANDTGTASANGVNLTNKASEELATMVSEKEEGSEITGEDLNTVMGNVMAVAAEDIVLPEISTESIRVKVVPAKLSEDEEKEQNREDVVQYLTLVSYILISNAPVQIRDTQALEGFALNTGQQIVVSMLSGNYDYLDTIEERGKKALNEVSGVEVPESMVDTHVKTIKMLTFASNLKESIKATVSPDDPLGQMYMFSKAQGFLMTLDGFMQETQGKLTAIGIENIPLDI